MRCDECRFFHLPVETAARGECRRNPPRVIEVNKFGQWPTIDRSAWCGEYERNAA